jgi:hypothetical protein
MLFFLQQKDFCSGCETEMSMAALPYPRWRQRQFIFYYRRGAAAAASKKRKFKKLLNLHKIFILKNATL